jgi:hypothetical protein
MTTLHVSRTSPHTARAWPLRIVAIVVFGCAGLALAGPADAQTAQAPQLQAPAPDSAQKDPKLPSTGENLSERLDRSGGVIRPPAAGDAEIAVPPKDPMESSKMPVIPPPATAGPNAPAVPK